jgi:hypothetical protein
MSPELMLRRRISSGVPITGQSEALGGGWGTRSAVPVEFPANDSVMDFGMFSQGEWPDPLTSCRGYSYPVGIPITLQIGRFLSPRISSWSLKSKGESSRHAGSTRTNTAIRTSLHRNWDVTGWRLSGRLF